MPLNVAALSSPPMPAIKPQHGTVCHTAVVYWALRSLNYTEENAFHELQQIALRLCRKCRGLAADSGHVIDHDLYGQLFCRTAVALRPQQTHPGDVILLGGRLAPVHSMVCVRVSGNNIWVRGFNNFFTFTEGYPQNPPPYMAYDPVDRDLSRIVAFRGEGIQPTVMWRVGQQAYLEATRDAFNMEND